MRPKSKINDNQFSSLKRLPLGLPFTLNKSRCKKIKKLVATIEILQKKLPITC